MDQPLDLSVPTATTTNFTAASATASASFSPLHPPDRVVRVEGALNGRMAPFEIHGRGELIDLLRRIIRSAWPNCKPNEAFTAILPRVESVSKRADEFVDLVMFPEPHQRQTTPATAPIMVKPAAITQKGLVRKRGQVESALQAEGDEEHPLLKRKRLTGDKYKIERPAEKIIKTDLKSFYEEFQPEIDDDQEKVEQEVETSSSKSKRSKGCTKGAYFISQGANKKKSKPSSAEARAIILGKYQDEQYLVFLVVLLHSMC